MGHLTALFLCIYLVGLCVFVFLWWLDLHQMTATEQVFTGIGVLVWPLTFIVFAVVIALDVMRSRI